MFFGVLIVGQRQFDNNLAYKTIWRLRKFGVPGNLSLCLFCVNISHLNQKYLLENKNIYRSTFLFSFAIVQMPCFWLTEKGVKTLKIVYLRDV